MHYSYSMTEMWACHLPGGSFFFLLNTLYIRQRKCTGAKYSIDILPQSMNVTIVPLQLCVWFSTLMMRGFIFEFCKEGVSEQLPKIASVKE